MKVVVAEALDSLESYQLTERAVPAPGPHQLLIRVAACGVGYVDALVSLGKYQVKPPLPHIPGQEVAGIVEAVGDGVTGFAPGDRVLTMARHGFAEYVVAPAATSFALPDTMDFAAAAAFPLNYLTVIHALRDRAALQANEWVLIFGAAGGVGSAAIQVAKAMGAKVVAAASSEEKRAFALKQGADVAIDTVEEGWRERLKAACGGTGPDVIVDPVCGPLFGAAFRSLKWRGRHLVIGFVGGVFPRLPVNLPLMKGAALVGVDVRQFLEYEHSRAMGDLSDLLDWVRDGRLNPPVGPRFAMADYGAAMTTALSGTVQGKVVLDIADLA